MTVPASRGGHSSTPAHALGASTLAISLLGMLLLGGDMKRKRQLCKGLLIASAMLMVMGVMSACASNPGGGNKNVTPPGTSTITVTAAGSGSTSHNVSVTLVVQ
jgi:hypothetical protein